MVYKSLKRSEKKTIDQALDMQQGYVLDFSNRTIEEWFEDELDIQFYDESFSHNGNSKANRLRTILQLHIGPQAAEILRKLWDYRSMLPVDTSDVDLNVERTLRDKFFNVVERLEGDGKVADLSAF